MDWLSRYLEWTKESEAPLTFHEAAGMSAIAGATERKVWFNQGIDLLYPNLYITLVGPPASRKTAAIEKAQELLEVLETVDIAPTAITKEALYQYMAKQTVKEFKHKGGMIQHSSLTVMADEWGAFIGERDAKFITALIKLYDCKRLFKYYTKHQGKDIIHNVFLNMLAGIQPEILPEILPKSAIGSGFTSRVIYVVEEGARHNNPLPTFPQNIQEELIHGLNVINGRTGEFTFTSESGAWYKDWYMNKKSVPDTIQYDRKFLSYAHRKPQHLLKIALIHSLSRDYGESGYIVLEDLEKGLKWLERVEKKMHMAYGSFGMSDKAAVTQQVLKLVQIKKSVTIAEIMGGLYKDIDKTELFKILDTLQLMGKVIIKTDRVEWKNSK